MRLTCETKLNARCRALATEAIISGATAQMEDYFAIPPDHARLEQLAQLMQPTWDGNLISKLDRDRLAHAGLVDRHLGWNFLTPRGVEVCIVLGYLRA